MHTGLVVVGKEQNVAEEAKFTTLNGKRFVRAATVHDQWLLLVSAACTTTGVPITAAVREYLAEMLWHFMCRVDLLEQLAVFDFYRHVVEITRVNRFRLQEIADIILQYVAFSPEDSSHRRQPRSLEEISRLGSSLYLDLATNPDVKNEQQRRAFYSMANSFGHAVRALRSVCPMFALERQVTQVGLRMKETPHAPSSRAMRAQEFLEPGLLHFQSEGIRVLKNN